MTSTMTSDTTREQVVKKHPVRGAIWGVLLGCSLAVYAVLFAVIPFTDWVPLGLVVVAGVAIGVAWAYLAPAKKAKGGPPPSVADAEQPQDAFPASEESMSDDGPLGSVPADDVAPGTDDVSRPSEDPPDDPA